MKDVIPAKASSWVPGADGSMFPIQSLPFCRFLHETMVDSEFGLRLGDYLISVTKLVEDEVIEAYDGDDPLYELGLEGRVVLNHYRKAVYELFRIENAGEAAVLEEYLIDPNEVHMELPMDIPQFVDFYSVIYQASNVGKMFRPDMPPLLPNYRHVPIGYNGRANTVFLSGTPVTRPNGQTKGANDELPSYGATKELDFELELGVFMADGTPPGKPRNREQVQEAMLGFVLVNDWSARDIQRWEYQPLGPFLAKSFATTISPYVIPVEVMERFRVKGIPQEPAPLEYLQVPEPRVYDIHLEVLLKTAKAKKPVVICTSNAQHLYWSFEQQLIHQSGNGTPFGQGDLYATGTISGPEEGSFGSLLEATWRGSKPLEIAETGETRTFLQDGDTIIMRAWAECDDYKIGFGECSGTIYAEAQPRDETFFERKFAELEEEFE